MKVWYVNTLIYDKLLNSEESVPCKKVIRPGFRSFGIHIDLFIFISWFPFIFTIPLSILFSFLFLSVSRCASLSFPNRQNHSNYNNRPTNRSDFKATTSLTFRSATRIILPQNESQFPSAHTNRTHTLPSTVQPINQTRSNANRSFTQTRQKKNESIECSAALPKSPPLVIQYPPFNMGLIYRYPMCAQKHEIYITLFIFN